MILFLKKVFDFFVFTSLFIACCAVLMVYQTAFLFHLSPPSALYAFVFCGTLCSYNFHWYLTPPSTSYTTAKLVWNTSNRKMHLMLATAGIGGAAFFALQLLQHWRWLGVTAFVTFLYSAPKINHPLTIWLRKIAVAKTFFLAFAWTHVTCILPLLFDHTVFSNAEILFVLNRFFFIYAICQLFDRRDVASDKAEGIKSIVTELSAAGLRTFFGGTCVAFLVSSALLGHYFSPLIVVALGLPCLIVTLLYKKAERDHSDYLYYFVLDGLMMLSLPLLLLAKFAA